MKSIFALALAVVPFLAPAVRAERIERSVLAVFPPGTTALTVSLPRLPAAAGTLVAAEFSLEVQHAGRVELENTSPNAEVVEIIARREARLTVPGLGANVAASPRTRLIFDLPAFDGVLDHAGPSGRIVGGFQGTDSDVVDLSGAALAPWIGGGALQIPIQVVDQHLARGSATATQFLTTLYVTAKVTYLVSDSSAVVRTLHVPSQQIPWVGFQLVDAFPPAMGELERVDIQARAIFNGTAGFESEAPQFSQINITHGGFLDFRLASTDLELLLTAPVQARAQHFVEAFDLIPDDAGLSGWSDTVVGRNFSLGGVSFDAPFMLQEFVSAAQIGVIVELLDANFAVGPGGVFFNAVDDVELVFTFVYHFDPARERFCLGNGGQAPGCTPCPCLNDDFGPGARGGCMTSLGHGAELFASGDSSVTADALRFAMMDAPPRSFAVLTSANLRLPVMGVCPPGSGVVSGLQLDGLRCVGGSLLRHGARGVDMNGRIGDQTPGWGPPHGPVGGLAAQGGFLAGATRQFQAFFRDNPALSPCGNEQNTTNGFSVAFRP